MATKKIKGVVIPRHDTAINWAKATTFIPSDGELIIFSSDSQSVVDAGYDVSSTIATNLDGSTGSFIPEPSAKTRFKFGDGKTNVNLLPFVSKEVSESDADSATKAWVEEYIDKYDSVSMSASKRDVNVLQIEGVHPVNNNAKLKLLSEGEEGREVHLYSKNLIDEHQWSNEVHYGLRPTYLTRPYLKTNANEDWSTDYAGLGWHVETVTTGELDTEGKIMWEDCDYHYSESPTFALTPNTTYHFIFYIDVVRRSSLESYDDIVDLRISRSYFVQDTTNDVSTHKIALTDSEGCIDSSMITYPTTVAVYGPLYNNRDSSETLVITYDTEPKVQSTYNEFSATPQSGTAVAEAIKAAVDACYKQSMPRPRTWHDWDDDEDYVMTYHSKGNNYDIPLDDNAFMSVRVDKPNEKVIDPEFGRTIPRRDGSGNLWTTEPDHDLDCVPYFMYKALLARVEALEQKA